MQKFVQLNARGQITIPKEQREQLQFKEGLILVVEVKEETLIIRNAKNFFKGEK